MNIVGVGAAFCMGYCPNMRNGTAIAAPAVWVSPPNDHDVRGTSCKHVYCRRRFSTSYSFPIGDSE